MEYAKRIFSLYGKKSLISSDSQRSTDRNCFYSATLNFARNFTTEKKIGQLTGRLDATNIK